MAILCYLTPEGNRREEELPSVNGAIIRARADALSGVRVLHLLDDYGVVALAFDESGVELDGEALAAYADGLRGAS